MACKGGGEKEVNPSKLSNLLHQVHPIFIDNSVERIQFMSESVTGLYNEFKKSKLLARATSGLATRSCSTKKCFTPVDKAVFTI